MGEATNVNFTFTGRLDSTRTCTMLSALHPDKLEISSEFRDAFQPGKNTQGGCKAGPVRIVVWGVWVWPGESREAR